MIQTAPINLEEIEFFSTPFPHFHSMRMLDPDVALRMLQWLESSVHWEFVETCFYEQFEFSLGDVEIPDHLSLLGDGSFKSAVLDQMSSTFNVPLADEVEMVAHKLVPGQRIRIHNDCLEGGETHRLVIQLNSGWTNANGGHFVIFANADAENVHRIIAPLHNSAIGFAITSNSHHAVSTIYNDARYSLVCSFRSLR